MLSHTQISGPSFIVFVAFQACGSHTVIVQCLHRQRLVRLSTEWEGLLTRGRPRTTTDGARRFKQATKFEDHRSAAGRAAEPNRLQAFKAVFFKALDLMTPSVRPNPLAPMPVPRVQGPWPTLFPESKARTMSSKQAHAAHCLSTAVYPQFHSDWSSLS